MSFQAELKQEHVQLKLSSRPPTTGFPSARNFQVVKQPVPQLPGPGAVLIKVLYISLDPAMRGWMRPNKSYIPPVKLGTVMRAGAVGRVVASRNDKFPVGSYVEGGFGWQSHFLSRSGRDLRIIKNWFKSQNNKHWMCNYLSVLGMTGLTAYFGLLDKGRPQPGDTVFVSGAAGAVGSVVGQIAKLMGCRVVGTAGSDDKCRWVERELGFDHCMNYKKCGKSVASLARSVAKACPGGVDVYFDNVGGPMLDALLLNIRPRGRLVICGAISQYNTPTGEGGKLYGPSCYLQLLVQRAEMLGFVVFDYASQYKTARKRISRWVEQGLMRFAEHVVDGLEEAPNHLMMLFNGKNQGKLIIRVDPEDPDCKGVRGVQVYGGGKRRSRL